jgi:ferric-dicitrate binding protein FerR (iron transport regulator)
VGRRSRARRTAATPGGIGDSPGWGLLHRLNPIKSPPGRRRVLIAAALFAVGAAVLAVVGWVTGRGAWFNPAIYLGILAVIWGLYSLTIREDNRSS